MTDAANAERALDIRTTGALAAIELALRTEIGLDPTTVGSTLVQRAAHRRMQKRSIASMESYANRLATDAEELQELVEEVVVPETYFFREAEAIADIAHRAVAGERPLDAGAPFRVLSVPCSTGEEPYSIAIALLEAGLAPGAISIDAIDVSFEAVRRAKSALFRDSSFRGEAGEWTKYFERTTAGLRLDESVRALVRIEHGNIMSPAFKPPRAEYDVVFCRNLLIYFDAEAQERALANLASLLAPEGILVVGSADSFAARRGGFRPARGSERAFLFQLQRRAPETEQGSAMPRCAPAPARRTRSTPIQPVRPVRADRARHATRLPPAVAPSVRRDESPTMNEVARLADIGDVDAAIALAERAVRDGKLSAELLGLLGTLHAAASDLARAEECYRRALFLEPTNELALLHLSLLLDRRGDGALAERLRARARRAMSFNAAAAR